MEPRGVPFGFYPTDSEEGRRLLSEAQLPGLEVSATMLEAAERVVALAAATPTVHAS